MFQERCCRDITETLQKSIARHYIKEFAARLDVAIGEGAEAAEKRLDLEDSFDDDFELAGSPRPIGEEGSMH